MDDAEARWFERLTGTELGGVTFVRDYVQLFWPGLALLPHQRWLNVLSPITVTSGGEAVVMGTEDFANALIAQIGKTAAGFSFEPEVALRIRFTDGSVISLSLRPEETPYGAYE